MSDAPHTEAALAACDAHFGKQYEAALAREEELRALAFQPRFIVAATVIRAVNLNDWRLHVESGNCLFGSKHGLSLDRIFDDCVRFLWWQKADRRDHWFPRAKFKRAMRRRDRAKVREEVLGHLEMLYLDKIIIRQPMPGAASESHWSYEASVIDQLAARYGWTADYILSLPLAAIRQFENIILVEALRKADKKYSFEGLDSQKIKGAWGAHRLRLLSNTQTGTA